MKYLLFILIALSPYFSNAMEYFNTENQEESTTAHYDVIMTRPFKNYIYRRVNNTMDIDCSGGEKLDPSIPLHIRKNWDTYTQVIKNLYKSIYSAN